jgi:hypothetical protein
MEGRMWARCGWLWAALLALHGAFPDAWPQAGLRAGARAHGSGAAAWLVASEGARTPRRYLDRSSSLDWLPDVGSRLRALESHAADAARERLREATIETSPSGQSAPRLPAAGDGRAR